MRTVVRYNNPQFAVGVYQWGKVSLYGEDLSSLRQFVQDRLETCMKFYFPGDSGYHYLSDEFVLPEEDCTLAVNVQDGVQILPGMAGDSVIFIPNMGAEGDIFGWVVTLKGEWIRCVYAFHPVTGFRSFGDGSEACLSFAQVAQFTEAWQAHQDRLDGGWVTVSVSMDTEAIYCPVVVAVDH